MNLFLLNENFAQSLSDSLLTIVPVFSVICGVFVIVAKNPIVSVLFLIGLFLSVASYLIILGMSFIGLSYLLVYVGAVSILFLFILMLINVRVSELVTDNNNGVPLSIAIIVIFSFVFQNKIPTLHTYNLHFYEFLIADNNLSNLYKNFHISDVEISANTVNFASSQAWDTSLAEVSHITSIGNILYTSYPILLIITSLILLLAMVGAIIITLKE